jgi:hypothetical protein
MFIEDLTLFSELTDSCAEMISGGTANPANNGMGTENSASGPAVENCVKAFNNSPNTPGNGNNPKSGFAGVANCDHTFNE